MTRPARLGRRATATVLTVVVTVLIALLAALYDATGASASPVGTTGDQQATQSYDLQLSTQLQTMIDQAAGPGSAVVTVNATLNFNATSTNRQVYAWYKTNPPLAQQSRTLTSTGTSTYQASSVTVNNALGVVSQTVQNAPGQVQRLAIAVLLDKASKNVTSTAVTRLVKSGVGFSPSRGDTLSVQAITFNRTQQLAAAQAAATAAKQGAAQAATTQKLQLVKWGALGLIAITLTLVVIVGVRRLSRG